MCAYVHACVKASGWGEKRQVTVIPVRFFQFYPATGDSQAEACRLPPAAWEPGRRCLCARVPAGSRWEPFPLHSSVYYFPGRVCVVKEGGGEGGRGRGGGGGGGLFVHVSLTISQETLDDVLIRTRHKYIERLENMCSSQQSLVKIMQ